jgi:hypothetical protein
MQAKITYLLLNAAVGSLPHTPHAVSGSSGLTYGHAMFSKEHNAHVLEVDQEKWEGPMGRDVTNASHRSLNKWIVRAKVVAVLDEEETNLVTELDQAKSAQAQAEVARDEAVRARIAIEGDLETMRTLLSQAQAPATTPATDIAEGPHVPVNPLLPPPRRLTLENQGDWTYPELKALAKERGLDLGANPKRTAVIDALLAVPA